MSKPIFLLSFSNSHIEDFGDGGAFPEIHVAQYPQDMGRKNKAQSTAVVPLSTDSEGKVRYDALITQGKRENKIVHSTYKDLIPAQFKEEDLQRPGPDEEKETTEKTRFDSSPLLCI